MTLWVNTPNGGTLNLRKNPNTNSAILARIPNGTPLTAEEEDIQWLQVTYEGKTGWVLAEYLSYTAPAAGTVTTARMEALEKRVSSLEHLVQMLELTVKEEQEP